MGFPPDTLPLASLPLGRTGFLEKKSLPVPAALNSKLFSRPGASGLGDGGEVSFEFWYGEGGQGSWGWVKPG